ncbi:MAG: GntR family transcriptional regulator [Desulfarculaceae bacterium]
MAIPKKKRLGDLAYKVIREMIAEHRFQPGTRINVETLRKELGVSRTPVWEAINKLEQEGLVKNIPNRGVYMIELTLQDTLYLYQVREVLESLAARLAAKRMDDATTERMAENLILQERAVEEVDLRAYTRLDYDFHASVYRASGNPYLQETLETIKNKMRPLSVRLHPILTQLYNHHLDLFEALKARNPAASESAFKIHNRFIVDYLEQVMAEEGDNPSELTQTNKQIEKEPATDSDADGS